MRKIIMFLTIQLLASSLAFAAKPGFGAKETGDYKKSFIIGDFSNFSPDERDAFGLYRYGIGRGQLELGSPVGIFAEANNGILLTDAEGFVGGIEVLNGTLDYHNTMKGQLRPGFSAGYVKGPLYIAPRLLYTASNNSDTRNGLGVGSVIQFGPLVYWENPGTKIYSVNLGNKVNVERRMESNSGETWMFVVRQEL